MRQAIWLLGAGALLWAGCSSKPSGEAASADSSAAAVGGTTSAVSAATTAGATAVADSTARDAGGSSAGVATPPARGSGTAPPARTTQRDTTAPPPPAAHPLPASKPALVSVSDILGSDRWVGQTVRVTGRCLGYGSMKAAGGPPRTRSDWQLEADEKAIWATGPLPPGCSATNGADAPQTIIAQVAQDTTAGVLGRPRSVRRYLVVPAR